MPLEAARQRLFRLPVELASDLRIVDCVAQIVTRPVGDEFDEVFVRAMRRARQRLVEDGADHLDDRDIRMLLASSDVVGLADAALAQHQAQRRGVIADIEPIAHVLAVAINRQ